MKTVCVGHRGDDPDEQEILQVDGGENEPYHSEMDMDTGMDSCAPEKVRYHATGNVLPNIQRRWTTNESSFSTNK